MAQEAVLGHLEHNQEIADSGVFSQEKGISHDEIVNAIKSLNGFGLVIASVRFLLSLQLLHSSSFNRNFFLILIRV